MISAICQSSIRWFLESSERISLSLAGFTKPKLDKEVPSADSTQFATDKIRATKSPETHKSVLVLKNLCGLNGSVGGLTVNKPCGERNLLFIFCSLTKSRFFTALANKPIA